MTTGVNEKTGEKLLIDEFPKRILKMNEILSKPEFCTTALKTSNFKFDIPMDLLLQHHKMYIEMKKKDCDYSSIGAQKAETSFGIIPANKKIIEMTKIVKPNFIQLIEDLIIVKMWVSLLVPKIEDGDNFGVSIQEEILRYIQSIEENCTSSYIRFSGYNITRAGLLTKLVKNPYIEDYRLAIEDLDEKQYSTMSFAMYGYRNYYLKLQDIITKNLDIIKKPRSSNMKSFY